MPEKHISVTPGRLLSAAREASNQSPADIAKLTRLPLSVIQNIEADHYAEFGSSTFVRGYLRGYARLVGISEAEINEALDASGLLSAASYTTTASVGGAPVMNVTRQKQTLNNPRWVIAGCVTALVIALCVVWKSQDHMMSKKVVSNNNATASIALPTQIVSPVVTTKTTVAAPVAATTAATKPDVIIPAKNIWVKKKDIGKMSEKTFKPTYKLVPVKNT